MMPRAILYTCLIGTLLGGSVWAHDVRLLSDQIGASAQMIAAGNIEGMYNGSTAVFENPAGLAHSKYAFSSMHTQLSDPDSTLLSLSGCIPFWYGHVAIGVLSSESKNLAKTSVGAFDQFQVDSTFGTHDSLYFLAFQEMVDPKVSVGMTLKYLDQDLLETHGKGINADIGLLYAEKNYQVSFEAKNVLLQSKVSFSEDHSDLSFPLQFCLGGKYRIGNLGIMGQCRYFDEGSLFLKAAGVDYSLPGNWASFYFGWKEVPVNGSAKTTRSLGTQVYLQTVAVTLAYELSDFIEQDSKYYLSLDLHL